MFFCIICKISSKNAKSQPIEIMNNTELNQPTNQNKVIENNDEMR